MSNELYNITDELLVNYLLNECNELEIAQVNTWLALSDENKVYYNQFVQIWHDSKILESKVEVDVDEAWMKLKKRIDKPKPSMHVNRLFYYMAAAILLLLGTLVMFKYIGSKKDKHFEPQIVIEKTIQSETATRVDTLSDKSIVSLNKHASLQYPSTFAAKERRVKLKGEAFFNITPNTQKPFFIEASNHVEIRVVGTSFNVKSFDAFTEVVVETGIVEIRQFNKVILLHPNERARMDQKDSSIVVEKSKDKLYTYYRSKSFECDNTPLWKVVEVLNEAYGDRVVIGRNELRSLTLTTRFDQISLEQILDIIAETFDIRVEKQGNKFILN